MKDINNIKKTTKVKRTLFFKEMRKSVTHWEIPDIF